MAQVVSTKLKGRNCAIPHLIIAQKFNLANIQNLFLNWHINFFFFHFTERNISLNYLLKTARITIEKCFR